MKPVLLDLFSIAKDNAAAVQTAFESTIAALPEKQARVMDEFASWVEAEALISINVKLYVIVEILAGRCYQNTHEWAREQSRLSGRNAEELLRERLREFYERRVAFDRACISGESFRYGALNAGGAGLVEWDPYCAVLTRDFQTSLSDIALLPGDSLRICFGSDGSLNTGVIQSRAVPYTHRHWMVAKERANELHSTRRIDWAGLVLSPRRYFEVLFTDNVSLQAVHCVRVLKTEYDRKWEMAFANFAKELNEADRALVNDFVQLQRAVVDGKVELEVIA